MSDSGALKHPIEAYEKRIDDEIRIIQGMKYPGYFLIVWDLIRFARNQGYSGWARTWLCRRQPGFLLHAHH
jgi:DNA polymerase III alpha subunit